ncbi:MAG: hypothetical protein ACW99G_11645 [Candidatus Thorarchaeota archaeon]
MITVETFAKVQDALAICGTNGERRDKADLVLTRANPNLNKSERDVIIDTIKAGQGLYDQIVDLESKVETHKATIKHLENRWGDVKQHNFMDVLIEYQSKLDADTDEVELATWLAETLDFPVPFAAALYEHTRQLEELIVLAERERYKAEAGEAKEIADRAVSEAWSAGEIERQKALGWQKRYKALRIALIQLAEAPKICDHCSGKLLSPAPHAHETLMGFDTIKAKFGKQS